MTPPPDPNRPTPSPSPTGRHAGRWIVLPILIAAGVVCVIAWFLRPRGPEPVDESLLQPRAVAGPTHGNSVVLLDQALDRLRSTNELTRLLRKPQPGESAESRRELVEQVLDAERETLALVHRAFLAPHCELVEQPRWTTNGWNSRGWSRLAQLAALPVRERPEASQAPEDWDLALNLVRLGHRLEDAGGTFVDYLDAWAVKRIGLSLLRRLAGRPSGNAGELTEHARTLVGYSANTPGLTNAIRWNFLDFLNLVEAEIGPVTENPLYSQSRSRALRARGSLDLLSRVAAPPGSASAIPDSSTERPSGLKLLFRGNALGNLLEGMAASQDESLLLIRNNENITVSATRLVLALRAFELENGTLPEALSELVPRWLDAVPTDDHDGQPIRWSRERRLLWSVGQDGRDNGGIERNARRHEYDMVFQLDE